MTAELDNEAVARVLAYAVETVRRSQGTLPHDVHERTWCAHLGCELARAPELGGWDVDVEYNRLGEDTKRSEARSAIIPDLIVHRRKSPANLVAIEAKPNLREAGADAAKLHDYAAGSKRYSFVAAVAFDGRPPLVWTRDEATRLGVDGIQRDIAAAAHAPVRDPAPAFHTSYCIGTWEGIVRTARVYGESDAASPGDASTPENQWVFRGQRDSSWPLHTSLDRLAARWPPRNTAPHRGWKRDLEAALVREFHRRAHLHRADIAGNRRSVIEWLAMMQHFGTPTRLLDFSYSFWVALFFALEEVSPSDRVSPCVWAIDTAWLKEASLQTLAARGGSAARSAHLDDLHAASPETFDRVYRRSPPIPFVLKQNCWRFHERLVAQQGVFLCPGDVERGFQENLDALGDDVGSHVHKIEVRASLVREVLSQLHRMNINAATLYPGLEGFARSLKTWVGRDVSVHPPDTDVWGSFRRELER